MMHGHAEHFRTLMQSYFDEMKALSLAAKAVGLSSLPVAEQNHILFGLVEVMAQTSTEVDKDLAHADAAQPRFSSINGGRS